MRNEQRALTVSRSRVSRGRGVGGSEATDDDDDDDDTACHFPRFSKAIFMLPFRAPLTTVSICRAFAFDELVPATIDLSLSLHRSLSPLRSLFVSLSQRTPGSVRC